jgi:hypothetical protein
MLLTRTELDFLNAENSPSLKNDVLGVDSTRR